MDGGWAGVVLLRGPQPQAVEQQGLPPEVGWEVGQMTLQLGLLLHHHPAATAAAAVAVWVCVCVCVCVCTHVQFI